MDPIEINGVPVNPGEQSIINIPIGTLPPGNEIHMKTYIFRSHREGPVMLILAGIHGDEVNGVEILRRALTEQYFDNLECGTVIAVPLVNVYGFINFSRSLPDGKDVNRSFPGTAQGSLASRVANALTQEILPLADFGVDFHTGGNSHYNHPQIRYSQGDKRARELAGVFASPYILEKKTIRKSLRHTAGEMGKPILVFEGGENLRYDGLSITRGLAGLRRLLIHHGMWAGTLPEANSMMFNKSSWLRASLSGMFLWYKSSGNQVYKDEPIGEINSPYGNAKVVVKAPTDAYIIGHNNAPVVSLGDALFHLAYRKKNTGTA